MGFSHFLEGAKDMDILAQVGITTIDKVIVWVYLIGIMIIGIAAGYKKKASSEEFFLAGRTLPWPMVGAALFCANISTIHLVGLAASGYGEGIVVGNFEWMAAFCLIVLGLIFVPFYFRTNLKTLPEFLEKRYSTTCRMILAFIAIWSALLVHIGVSLYAGATVFEYFFGVPAIYAIIIIAVITAVYTILGGLKAVVVTDTIQVVLLLGGCILLTVFGLIKLGDMGITNLTQLKAAVNPDQLSMVHTLRDANGNFNQYSWLTVMFGYHVLGIWYWCTDQTIVQKTLGAKNLKNAQVGAVFAGVLKILPLFFMVFPGVIAYVLFKSQIGGDNDMALTVMIDNLLPPVLKGLFAAGLLAAVMSTVEAALNSTATVTAEDIVQHIWPNIKDRTLVLIGRITAGVVIVLAMIWSPYCEKFENIFIVINKVPMMFAPAITTVFVLGVFWKRGNKHGALATFIVGVIIGLGYFLVDLPKDRAAADVLHAINAKRVSVGKVVEEWVAMPVTDVAGVIGTGQLSIDKISNDWKGTIPNSVRKAAAKTVKKQLKLHKITDAEEKLPEWVAMRLVDSQAAIKASGLTADKMVKVWGSVPEAEATAAIAAGVLPSTWMVLNYGVISEGKGIPFMMMGLVLLGICVVVYVVVSLATRAPTQEELDRAGWQPPLRILVETKLTGITDPRIISIGLIVLMIVLYYFMR